VRPASPPLTKPPSRKAKKPMAKGRKVRISANKKKKNLSDRLRAASMQHIPVADNHFRLGWHHGGKTICAPSNPVVLCSHIRVWAASVSRVIALCIRQRLSLPCDPLYVADVRSGRWGGGSNDELKGHEARRDPSHWPSF